MSLFKLSSLFAHFSVQGFIFLPTAEADLIKILWMVLILIENKKRAHVYI